MLTRMITVAVVVVSQVVCSGTMKTIAVQADGDIELSKDTVYANDFLHEGSTDTCKITNNTSADVLIEQILDISDDSQWGSVEQIYFRAYNSNWKHIETYMLGRRHDGPYKYGTIKISVPAAQHVYLSNFECAISIPIAKGNVVNEVDYDTATVPLVLVSSGGPDTLVITGRVIKYVSRVMPQRSPYSVDVPKLLNTPGSHGHDLLGRTVSACNNARQRINCLTPGFYVSSYGLGEAYKIAPGIE